MQGNLKKLANARLKSVATFTIGLSLGMFVYSSSCGSLVDRTRTSIIDKATTTITMTTIPSHLYIALESFYISMLQCMGILLIIQTHIETNY